MALTRAPAAQSLSQSLASAFASPARAGARPRFTPHNPSPTRFPVWPPAWLRYIADHLRESFDSFLMLLSGSLRPRQDSAHRRVLPTTDSVLPFPGLPGASSSIGGVTSVLPASGVLPTSDLPGVSSGIGGVTSVLPASGVLPTSGPPGRLALGSTFASAVSSTIGAFVTVDGIGVLASVPINALVLATVNVSSGLTGTTASASVSLVAATLPIPAVTRRRRNQRSAAGLNGNGAGRARGRQITHYGAGDVDYSPSPSPPIFPGLGPAFGRSNDGGAGAGRAGYLVEHGVRRAGKLRAYDNGLADSDVLTNPLLHSRAGVNGGASSTETGQRRLSWTRTLFRPTRDQVERWLDSWLKRWFVLAIIPALDVWIWCAVLFPHSDSDSVGAPWGDPKTSAWTIANHSQPSLPHLPTTLPPAPAAAVDANFVFFLLFYYGIYVTFALIYVTQLFSLYRLN
ncbi:hypothetical protein OC835_007542 [Tilletia horrida]|nr:hypothetical protein OC835_007542 [Tilletia horrida]